MSPNEFQLRNALHDGEGATPDADRLIAHAVGVRRDRRRRLNTVMASGAAVAVVGLVATVLVAVGNDNESGSSAAVADRGAAAAAQSTRSSGAAAGYGSMNRSRVGVPAPQASTGASGSSASTTRCPSEPERYMLPGGGGLGRFGSDEALVPGSVTSLRLCGYPLRASAGRTTALVDGSAAASIIRSLNAAPTTRTGVKPCPANINSAAGTLEIIGLTAASPTTPVVLTIGCPTSQATNGTAVRYLRDVPQTLMQMVIPIPLKSTAGGVPGKITISPVR